MADLKSKSWSYLRENIGIKEVNEELDRRIKVVFDTLRDVTSVCGSSNSLLERVKALKDSTWFEARDQYERTVLHLAALHGNTRLVYALVHSGARINERDGIGQTALTLSLHMGHSNTAKVLMELGASVHEHAFPNAVPPLEIATVKNDTSMIVRIEEKLKEEKAIKDHVAAHFETLFSSTEFCKTNASPMEIGSTKNKSLARSLNINVGDQKNTVTIQGCANRCPDIYGSHTPGGGDFHNRGYMNESIARIAGPGGFWHVTENVMKRPTVNPLSFKNKFKENNYNNNEEALLDYDDGVSIAMLKTFQDSIHFPSTEELKLCLMRNGSHNEILLQKFHQWIDHCVQEDEQFLHHHQILNELMPMTRWYKESIRNGNGIAIEGVWMLCPPLYCQMNKTNYRDEAFTQVVNSVAKWPLAFRRMYQQNRTVNVDGRIGKQLAGDEWVEDHLVKPVKQFAKAQSSFAMVELMSCSANLLDQTRAMYKGRHGFDVHLTRKHQKPSSLYDQLKVAQFALKEDWFCPNGRSKVKKYAWADKKLKPDESVPSKYINALVKGETKAKNEFIGFLHRKYPNDML